MNTDYNNKITYDSVRKIVIESLNRIGVGIENDDDVNLTEYDIDSISFVSFLIDIENELGICLPDRFINFDILQSLNGFVNMLVLFMCECDT